MSKDDKFDADKFKDEYNRRAILSDFPSKDMWAQMEGVRFAPQSDGRNLVSISGKSQAGETVTLWTDLPNAMFLLSQLLRVQQLTGAKLETEQPPAAPGHPN